MKFRQRLFIFDHKELAVLLPLIFMVSLFTFTLGIHLGKRVGTKSHSLPNENVEKAQTLADQNPTRHQLLEQGKGEQVALEETLNQELHDEVTRSGIKLNIPRQVNLPEETKVSLNHSTTSEETQSHHPSHPYTLQIGSYPTLAEAKKHLQSIAHSELQPFWREAELKGKGKWYRLYLGKFQSRNDAEQAGQKYRSQHMIDSFIVSKLFD